MLSVSRFKTRASCIPIVLGSMNRYIAYNVSVLDNNPVVKRKLY